MTRRAATTLFILASLFAGMVVGVWGRWIEPRRFRVVRVPVALPRRHHHLSGLTIAFVTDLHVGPHIRAAMFEPVVEKLERIEPDIVLFGGDYICESPRFMAETAPMLGRIASTARVGAWAVLGNHDVANFRERVVPPLESQGIVVLSNQARAARTRFGDLWIVGLDDLLLGRPDLDAAFGEVPAEAPCVCLWHEGDLADKAAPYGPILQLSGHSHGGQVRLPVIGPVATPRLGRRYVRGRFQIDDMELYVSSGLGMYRPPVRLNCPPELTIVQFVE